MTEIIIDDNGFYPSGDVCVNGKWYKPEEIENALEIVNILREEIEIVRKERNRLKRGGADAWWDYQQQLELIQKIAENKK